MPPVFAETTTISASASASAAAYPSSAAVVLCVCACETPSSPSPGFWASVGSFHYGVGQSAWAWGGPWLVYSCLGKGSSQSAVLALMLTPGVLFRSKEPENGDLVSIVLILISTRESGKSRKFKITLWRLSDCVTNSVV
ncbi:hypothetical protein BU16DRAFT_576669 [Lophium mytilinum]|uniref:Uncharacterized protein n=1 Tax=Lophium mytilinum TaxID=390894 RepID=A0A6A6RDG6_9PEZI|nr:hypothetical protein BU16DRAFT_576669 [Lophium mytilinum]